MAVITIPGMFLTGDHASRPAANTVGTGSLYSCSTHGLIYQSDGSNWSATFWYSPANASGISPTLSYGSNATHVTQFSTAGSSNAVARADHAHAGVAQITSSSSNTLQRGTVNFRPGTNVTFGVTDADGEGTLDTITIHSTASGGGGGGSPATAIPGWVADLVGTTDTTNFYWDGNDLAGFTEVDPTGTTTWAEGDNLASVIVAGTTSGDANCLLIAKTISAGDTWQVPVMGVLGHTAGGASIWAGICMTDGTTNSSNIVLGHVQVLDVGGATHTLLVGRHGTIEDVSTAPWVLDDNVASPQLFLGYIRLEYDAANTFILSFSPNGVQFHSFGEASISKTMTPTHVGLAVACPESDGAIITFGPLRKVA